MAEGSAVAMQDRVHCCKVHSRFSLVMEKTMWCSPMSTPASGDSTNLSSCSRATLSFSKHSICKLQHQALHLKVTTQWQCRPGIAQMQVNFNS